MEGTWSTPEGALLLIAHKLSIVPDTLDIIIFESSDIFSTVWRSFQRKYPKSAAFVETFRGYRSTDLVRGNLLTLACWLLSLLIVIFCFPYKPTEFPQSPANHTLVERSISFSPVSDWPENVVEKGLNFSSEYVDVLTIWGDRSRPGAEFDDGKQLAGTWLLVLKELSEEKLFRHDFKQASIEYQRVSSATSNNFVTLSTDIRKLADEMKKTSDQTENKLRNIFLDTQRLFVYRIFSMPLDFMVEQALKLIPAQLSPHLEELLVKATDFHEDLSNLERLLNALANPESHLLEHGNMPALHSAQYWARQLQPYSKMIKGSLGASKASAEASATIVPSKGSAEVLAAFCAEIASLREATLEMKNKLTPMRINQFTFERWLAADLLGSKFREEKGLVQELATILFVNQKELEKYKSK